jgi:four helix bundle protein
MPNYSDPEGFAEWEMTVPESYRRDPIWKTPAYRFGLWLSDLVKRDAKMVLLADPTRHNDADQLLRAVGAISSNLAEGYGRSSGGERARYYDYALATTRESRDWYFKVRDVLGTDLMEQRHRVLERIVRILSVIIPRERDEGQKRGRRKRRNNRPPADDSVGN